MALSGIKKDVIPTRVGISLPLPRKIPTFVGMTREGKRSGFTRLSDT